MGDPEERQLRMLSCGAESLGERARMGPHRMQKLQLKDTAVRQCLDPSISSGRPLWGFTHTAHMSVHTC